MLGLKVHYFSLSILLIYCSFWSLANFTCFYLNRFSVLSWIGTYASPFFYLSLRIFLEWKEALICLSLMGLLLWSYLLFSFWGFGFTCFFWVWRRVLSVGLALIGEWLRLFKSAILTVWFEWSSESGENEALCWFFILLSSFFTGFSLFFAMYCS